MTVEQIGHEVFINDGTHRTVVATVENGRVVLQKVDLVMASVIGIELDKDGYIVVERSF